MKDKYVLDSSIWVEIERKNPVILALVQPWIDQNEICVVDVTIAELLRGVKTRRDYRLLHVVFENFPKIGTTWDRVADLAFRVAKRGFQPPLIDLYIAQCVWENEKTLITQDKHFSQILEVCPLKLKLLNRS
jgi:predicted nucleic acid-binding protein